MRIIFLTNDLVFPSRVGGIAQRLGTRMETAATAESLVAKFDSGVREPAIVLIDLNTAGFTVDTLAPKLKSLPNPPRAIIAFGSHVHEAKLAAAQSAGCDLVLPRGQFDVQIETLLQQFLEGQNSE